MDATTTIIRTIEVPVVSPSYVDLLERVNAINGTGLALANTFIAILAIVLTAGGIFVAYITWRNSREQKEERRKIHLDHEEQLAEQYRLLVSTYEERIKELMERIEGIATTAESTGNGVSDTKKKLEELVTSYQSKLEDLRHVPNGVSYISSTPDGIPMVKRKTTSILENAMNGYSNIHNSFYDTKTCPHCGKQYKVSRYDYTVSSSLYQSICPHCNGIV